MSHIGIICPPVSGHIHPFAALGRELQRRGHRVTVFQVADLERKIRGEGLEFSLVGESDHPLGTLPASLRQLGQLKGLAALRFTIAAVAKTTEMICRDAPEAVRAAGIDLLLVDQMEPAGGAVAESLGLPFVTICNALAINREPFVPPPFTPWKYTRAWWAPLRNRAGYFVSDRLLRPIGRVVERHRAEWALPPLSDADGSFSPLAQICQMPRGFDYPRTALPPTFHYVGPLRGAAPTRIEFPWDRLDGRPLVYASLGTLQNSREPVFRCFAEACRRLNLQLALSHGGGLTEEQTRHLPGNPIVVGYAPQGEVLAKAALTLTHAGLNTVLDSLAAGVPMIAVPITYEQPAIAARVERCGAGCSLSLDRLTPEALTRLMGQVLGAAQYQTAARRLAQEIAAAGGTGRAADIVESILPNARKSRLSA